MGFFSPSPRLDDNPKNRKIIAATMLKDVLEGNADPANLKEHEKELNHGKLGKIYSYLKDEVVRRQATTELTTPLLH